MADVLTVEQLDLARHFSRMMPLRFEGLSFSLGLGNVPVLDGCAAQFECRKMTQHPGGNDIIVIGEVERFAGGDCPLLVFHGGWFFHLSSEAVRSGAGGTGGEKKLWRIAD